MCQRRLARFAPYRTTCTRRHFAVSCLVIRNSRCNVQAEHHRHLQYLFVGGGHQCALWGRAGLEPGKGLHPACHQGEDQHLRRRVRHFSCHTPNRLPIRCCLVSCDTCSETFREWIHADGNCAALLTLCSVLAATRLSCSSTLTLTACQAAMAVPHNLSGQSTTTRKTCTNDGAKQHRLQLCSVLPGRPAAGSFKQRRPHIRLSFVLHITAKYPEVPSACFNAPFARISAWPLCDFALVSAMPLFGCRIRP